MVSLQIPADEAVLFMGDINENMYTNPDGLQKMWDDLHAKQADCVFGALNYSSESIWNDVRQAANPNGRAGWIDHIAYRYGKLWSDCVMKYFNSVEKVAIIEMGEIAAPTN